MKTVLRTVATLLLAMIMLAVTSFSDPNTAYAEDACMAIASEICYTCGIEGTACKYLALQAVLTNMAGKISRDKNQSKANKETARKSADSILKMCFELAATVAEDANKEVMCRVLDIAVSRLP